MAELTDLHDAHGASFEERGGRQVVTDYGRPGRTHGAVRKGVGVIEVPDDILVVTGEDRVEYVNNAVSNVVPTSEGAGVYALLLTPQGRIRMDMYVFNAGDRLLLFLPPGEGEPLAADWREKTFIQDVTIEVATDEFGVFGVHGPQATEKIASVFSEQTPEAQLTFTRGGMGDAGVTVMRSDAPTGEEGYMVIAEASESADVFDTLENRGLNAVPFGYRTWHSLTLEAGTPLFECELEDTLPNNIGLENAVDYEKGCFVGQEVVSRIANRGDPNERLVGLAADALPAAGATVFAGDETVGTVTRSCQSPTRGEPIAMALVDSGRDLAATELSVRVDEAERGARVVELPFVDGSDRPARCPGA